MERRRVPPGEERREGGERIEKNEGGERREDRGQRTEDRGQKTLNDKLAANRAAREHKHLPPGEEGGGRGKAARGEGVGDRAAGGAAGGGQGGDGADTRVGGRRIEEGGEIGERIGHQAIRRGKAPKGESKPERRARYAEYAQLARDKQRERDRARGDNNPDKVIASKHTVGRCRSTVSNPLFKSIGLWFERLELEFNKLLPTFANNFSKLVLKARVMSAISA